MKPLISILTPTCPSRHPFLFHLLQLILRQQQISFSQVEWIILDNYHEHVHDIRYQLNKYAPLFYNLIYWYVVDASTTVGGKRNIMKQQAHGSFIIHMDDDDYYGPFFLNTLYRIYCNYHSTYSVFGSSVMYYLHPQHPFLLKTGPFSKNHTCANIMAYTKEYARTHHFNHQSPWGEERSFLDHFRQPVFQIPHIYRVFLPVIHDSNTFDKKKIQLQTTSLYAYFHLSSFSVPFYVQLYPSHLPFILAIHARNKGCHRFICTASLKLIISTFTFLAFHTFELICKIQRVLIKQ